MSFHLFQWHASVMQVKRDGCWRTIDSAEALPGDLVRIVDAADGWLLPYDVALTQGTAVCDESALTGESSPVQKTAAPLEDGAARPYSNTDHHCARFTLFAGTTVLQAGQSREEEILGVVVATGISTSKGRRPISSSSSSPSGKVGKAKVGVMRLMKSMGARRAAGRLLSSMLYPRKVMFKYDEELRVVFAMLLLFAIVCFALTITFQTRSGVQSSFVTKWGYGIFTISQILSPLIPIALVVGQINSSNRLRRAGIFTVDPARISISGKIRLFAFDKTGTLTKVPSVHPLHPLECSLRRIVPRAIRH
ncbi:hypothetical protein CYMTET_49348 [Cymbomonas tetramitiformis]|uniref:P-type ATPase A domain-containing protein n=1 Tax=Cymbomonas tetramitiformis TaxID=36881 RepID=A0AAE0BS25_9CHLO|nr:hypothetical protein CYMTET_49348 [Cymbomonas tetramitiformis]